MALPIPNTLTKTHKKSELPIEVLQTALPFSCPRPQDALWNAHPRVFLPIEQETHITCPYCGQEYFLNRSGAL